MYCNAQGHPDPNGDYEMRGGKMILRDGRRIGVDLSFMDAAPKPSGQTVYLTDAITFTDAERQFADSAEGQTAVAYAKSNHDLRHAYMGANAPAFTDAQAQAIVKSAVAQRAAQQQQNAAARDHAVTLSVEAEAAYQRQSYLQNAWRQS